jgi:DNA-binding NarL/FixJ family response regulator
VIVPVRVLLADDQSLVRSGFAALLDRDDGIEVVGEAADGHEAVTAVGEQLPDVVLMDIRMPEMDGLEATRRIVADSRLADVRVVVLTTFDLDEYVFEALRAGASGFLLKDIDAAELRNAVHTLAAGDALLSPGVTRRLIAEFVSRPTVSRLDMQRLTGLTEREQAVMAAAAEGASNEEIGAQLHMSPATARTHISRAMIKLGARDRAQLVVIAYQTGLAAPGRR